MNDWRGTAGEALRFRSGLVWRGVNDDCAREENGAEGRNRLRKTPKSSLRVTGNRTIAGHVALNGGRTGWKNDVHNRTIRNVSRGVTGSLFSFSVTVRALRTSVRIYVCARYRPSSRRENGQIIARVIIRPCTAYEIVFTVAIVRHPPP